MEDFVESIGKGKMLWIKFLNNIYSFLWQDTTMIYVLPKIVPYHTFPDKEGKITRKFYTKYGKSKPDETHRLVLFLSKEEYIPHK